MCVKAFFFYRLQKKERSSIRMFLFRSFFFLGESFLIIFIYLKTSDVVHLHFIVIEWFLKNNKDILL